MQTFQWNSGRRAAFVVVLLAPLLWASDSDAQTAKTTVYKYDALGRLTFVEDSQNGNRDYDYDRMGNRLSVAVGGADDAASNPPSQAPLAPTGRSKNQIANCAWRATWTHSGGASSYSLKNTLNQIFTVYPVSSSGSGFTVDVVGSTINVYMNCPYNEPQANEPGTVKACNIDGCSSYVSF